MTYQPPPMTDAELEQHIVDCGRHFLKAHAEGDMVLAREWLYREMDALRSRSPEQVARMEACYFAQQGEMGRLRAAERSVR